MRKYNFERAAEVARHVEFRRIIKMYREALTEFYNFNPYGLPAYVRINDSLLINYKKFYNIIHSNNYKTINIITLSNKFDMFIYATAITNIYVF